MTAAIADLLLPDRSGARSSAIREILAVTETTDVLSLAGGMPDPGTFPTDELAAAAHRAIVDQAPVALQYGRTEGLSELRGIIARDVADRRGRPCAAGEVLVTTGSQQALDLLARAFVGPGDEVAIDAPGYLGAIQAFGAAHARWLPVPVDDDGMRTDVLADALAAGHRPKLVYTVTDFQNPTGAVLSDERRVHLAALADRWGLVVVEDDPYGRIRFDEPEHAPVAAGTDRAICLGTCSKTIAPGLRVGWLSAPAEVTSALARLKQAIDLHTSTLDQWIVAQLLADPGWIDRRARSLSAAYRSGARTLHEALAEEIEEMDVAPARGGLFLWARLTGVDTTDLLPRAIDHGVAFVPGAAFRVEGTPTDELRLSFATLAGAELQEATRRLASAVSSVATPPRRPTPDRAAPRPRPARRAAPRR